ncbi:MAG: redoxin family protein [Phycisphaerales bacterium]
MRLAIAAMLTCALSASPAPGDAGGLAIGDPAPPIPASARWVQGEQVGALDDGRIYVLDFWATWCGPCIASIPEVQSMHADLAGDGVVVIGAHIWASPDAPTPDAFLGEIGDAMGYRIAEDTDGALARDFMDAAGRNGIPTMMVIDRAGTLVWIGHPMDGARDVVERVVAGTFDTDAAVEAEAQRERARAAAADANRLAREGDWDGALAKIDEAIELDPDGHRQLAVVKVQRLALTLDREDDAWAYGRTLVDGLLRDDAALLNNLARFIVEAPRLEPRDFALARAAAMRSLEVTDDTFADAMATLASIEFGEGRLEQAVEMQRRALAIAKGQESSLVREFELKLERYEEAWSKAKPPPF